MPTIMLDGRTHERLKLLARAWDVSPGEAVARLIECFASDPPREEATEINGEIPVHTVYKGVRVEATFDPATKTVAIKQGPLAGRTFKSPSGAAVAVVAAIDPDVNANRNGWGFWTVTGSGKRLASVR